MEVEPFGFEVDDAEAGSSSMTDPLFIEYSRRTQSGLYIKVKVTGTSRKRFYLSIEADSATVGRYIDNGILAQATADQLAFGAFCGGWEDWCWIKQTIGKDGTFSREASHEGPEREDNSL